MNAKFVAETLPRTETFLKSIGFLGPAGAHGMPSQAPAAKAPADMAARLASMLARNPEADTNKDGVLTMEEAAAFRGREQPRKASTKTRP